MTGRLADRIALVTGASKGIGAAIALQLAGRGYDIWLNYRSDHEAAARFNLVIGDPAGGLFAPQAKVALGNLALKAGKTEEALGLFEEVISGQHAVKVRGEAASWSGSVPNAGTSADLHALGFVVRHVERALEAEAGGSV